MCETSMLEPPRIVFNADHRRQLARLASHHFLNTGSLIARVVDSDLVTALTFLTISRANVRELTDAGLGAQDFAALEAVPPDELRRGVSVYAVARDLGIPYETVRRHVRKLRDKGVVDAGAEGLTIPRQVYAAPNQIEAVAQNWELVRAFVADAIRFGLVAPGPGAPPVADVRRQAVRLSIAYFLDSLGVIGRALEQDALSAMVFLAIGRGNVGHFVHDPATQAAYGSVAAIPPDDVRRPVSAYAVSRGLNLPYETTRRYGLKLVEQGWIERTSNGGLLVPASVVARPGMIQGVVDLAETTQAFLAEMLALGVPVEPV
jgi:DNA-binding transcriptional ArsR family regulator